MSSASPSPEHDHVSPNEPALAERERKARNGFRAYRVLAFVTGVMLLLLCAEMLIKYVFQLDEIVRHIEWIPFAHGWIYVIYLITVFNLFSIMRWPLKRVVFLVLAGVIPVLSFIMERRAHRWFEADLPGLLERVARMAR